MTERNFHVDVEGVGSFTFARRSLRDSFRIEAEYARLTESQEIASEFVRRFASAVAALKVQTVQAPADWAIDDADPFDPQTYERIIRVSEALKEREAFFRKRGSAQQAQAGEGTQP